MKRSTKKGIGIGAGLALAFVIVLAAGNMEYFELDVFSDLTVGGGTGDDADSTPVFQLGQGTESATGYLGTSTVTGSYLISDIGSANVESYQRIMKARGVNEFRETFKEAGGTHYNIDWWNPATSAWVNSLYISGDDGTYPGAFIFNADTYYGSAASVYFAEEAGTFFQMSADALLQFRDSALGIYSQADTFLDIYADGALRIGDSSAGAPTNHVNINSTGNLSFVGSAGLYPRTLSQNGEPAAGTGATQVDSGETIFWIDTDDSNRVYLIYNNGGTVIIVELT